MASELTTHSLGADFAAENVAVILDGLPSKLKCVLSRLAAECAALGIGNHTLEKTDCPDVWIRDWGSVAGCYFKYDPSYARGTFAREQVARARRNLNRHLGFIPRDVPVVLEGGNLIHNGKIAIVTEKIFADNHHLTRSEVERLILAVGFQRVVFIPVEPEDTIGHADGIVKFLAPDLLLVNDYRGSDFTTYHRKLFACLREAKIGVEIVPFPWFCTDGRVDGIWSAVGCYINFVLTKRGIIFPTFSNPVDEKVALLLDELSPLPKRSVESTALARQGGVLNCATLTF